MRRLAVVVALLAGCGGDPAHETVVDLCTRLDDCNLLPAGVSAPECVDGRDACVNHLSSSQQDDWDSLMQRCMNLQSCQLFTQCWLDVPWC